jgi:hypothetical protein
MQAKIRVNIRNLDNDTIRVREHQIAEWFSKNQIQPTEGMQVRYASGIAYKVERVEVDMIRNELFVEIV